MGLILDTSVLIASERSGEAVEDILRHLRTSRGDVPVALSVITALELTHGIHRAKTEADRRRRHDFAEGVFPGLLIYPLTLEIGQLAGRIEAEQASLGKTIAFQDLLNWGHRALPRIRGGYPQCPALSGRSKANCRHHLIAQ